MYSLVHSGCKSHHGQYNRSPETQDAWSSVLILVLNPGLPTLDCDRVTLVPLSREVLELSYGTRLRPTVVGHPESGRDRRVSLRPTLVKVPRKV